MKTPPFLYEIEYSHTNLRITDQHGKVYGTFFEKDEFGEANYWDPNTLGRCESALHELQGEQEAQQEADAEAMEVNDECFYCGAVLRNEQLYCNRDCKIKDAEL